MPVRAGHPEVLAVGRAAIGLGQSRLSRRDKRRGPHQWKAQRAKWVDKYPHVMGTFPEKLVFSWLADRGIPFVFQSDFPDYPGTLTVENLRPDFMLEWCKTIIEVQGEYFHSLPDAAEHDVYKFTIYELSGYRVLWFWESDILTNLTGLMMQVPEFLGYAGPGGWEWEQQIDDLAGLRAMNAKSRRAPAARLSRRKRSG